jgi:anti-sigma B factor antagonist
MTYKVVRHDTAYVVHLHGDRLDGQGAPALKLELKRLLETRSITVVVDFSKITFVDSSALGALVAGVRAAARSGGRLRVAGLCPNVQATFELAHLDRIFDIFPTEGEALAS